MLPIYISHLSLPFQRKKGHWQEKADFRRLHWDLNPFKIRLVSEQRYLNMEPFYFQMHSAAILS